MRARWLGLLALSLAAALASALAAWLWVGYDDDDPLSRAAFVLAFLVCLGPAFATAALLALAWRRSRGTRRRS